MLPGFEDELVRQLAAVANLLVRGEAPEKARAFLCGASLTALPKEEGDHRPIAVGEVLPRLVGKCCMGSVKDSMQELLEPSANRGRHCWRLRGCRSRSAALVCVLRCGW